MGIVVRNTHKQATYGRTAAAPRAVSGQAMAGFRARSGQ
jgi:hypothetical protein